MVKTKKKIELLENFWKQSQLDGAQGNLGSSIEWDQSDDDEGVSFTAQERVMNKTVIKDRLLPGREWIGDITNDAAKRRSVRGLSNIVYGDMYLWNSNLSPEEAWAVLVAKINGTLDSQFYDSDTLLSVHSELEHQMRASELLPPDLVALNPSNCYGTNDKDIGIFSGFWNDFEFHLKRPVKEGWGTLVPPWLRVYERVDDFISVCSIYHHNMVLNSISHTTYELWQLIPKDVWEFLAVDDGFADISEYDAGRNDLTFAFGDLNPKLRGRSAFPYYYSTRPWADFDGVNAVSKFACGFMIVSNRFFLKMEGHFVHDDAYGYAKRGYYLVDGNVVPEISTDSPWSMGKKYLTHCWDERFLTAEDTFYFMGGMNFSFVNLFTKLGKRIRYQRQIEPPLFVKALAPNRAVEQQSFMPRVSLAEPSDSTVNWDSRETALGHVLSPNNLLGTVARDIYYNHDVHAVHAVEMKKKSGRGKNSRSPKTHLLPIFYGKARADLYCNVNGAQRRLWQRGSMMYPWLHQDRADHDVPSASLEVGRFNVTNSDEFSVSLDINMVSVSNSQEIEALLGNATCYPARANEILVDQCNYAQLCVDAYRTTLEEVVNGIVQATQASGKDILNYVVYDGIFEVQVPANLLGLFVSRLKSRLGDTIRDSYPYISPKALSFWEDLCVAHLKKSLCSHITDMDLSEPLLYDAFMKMVSRMDAESDGKWYGNLGLIHEERRMLEKVNPFFTPGFPGEKGWWDINFIRREVLNRIARPYMSIQMIIENGSLEMSTESVSELATVVREYVKSLGMRVYIVNRHDSTKVKEFKLPYLRHVHLTGGE